MLVHEEEVFGTQMATSGSVLATLRKYYVNLVPLKGQQGTRESRAKPQIFDGKHAKEQNVK